MATVETAVTTALLMGVDGDGISLGGSGDEIVLTART
jgi:hypothetical protein